MFGKDEGKDEETQNIKSSPDEENESTINNMPTSTINTNLNLIVLFIALIIFVIIVIYFFIYRYRMEKLLNPKPKEVKLNDNPLIPYNLIILNDTNQNGTNNTNGTSLQDMMNQIQQNQALPNFNNQSNLLDQKSDKIKKTHSKHSDIPFYYNLPRNGKKVIKNLTKIFKSKTLDLTSKDINREYIFYIRPINEIEEMKYQKILFQNLSFENYTNNHTYNYSLLLSELNITFNFTNIGQNNNILKKKINSTISNNIMNKNISNFSNNIKQLPNNNNLTNNLKQSSNNNIINPTNASNNLTNNNKVNNKIINSNNLTNNLLTNNTLNITGKLRNLELESQQILREFYMLCNRKKIDEVKKNKSDGINYDEPLISIIMPLYNKKLNLSRTIRSIQAQTLKNIEIIIVDDNLVKVQKLYKNLINRDFRIRLFTQSKNLGIWRKRIDGFLYSRGKYILHINPGDILSDCYLLEDLYNLVEKYNLDTIRFSFSKTPINTIGFKKNMNFHPKRIYHKNFTKIIYGRPNYNIHIFGFGTIWNRLVRANILTKGLLLQDENIFNAYKDLWEDMWWNDLVDRVSFSNLVINRLGYIILYDYNTAIEPKTGNKFLRNKLIREFIYFWLFDYLLLPKNNSRNYTVNTLRHYSQPRSRFYNIPVSLWFLTSRCKHLEKLLSLLNNDTFVGIEDKKFINQLYKTTIRKIYKKI